MQYIREDEKLCMDHLSASRFSEYLIEYLHILHIPLLDDEYEFRIEVPSYTVTNGWLTFICKL